jgi:hypothetical protein
MYYFDVEVPKTSNGLFRIQSGTSPFYKIQGCIAVKDLTKSLY